MLAKFQAQLLRRVREHDKQQHFGYSLVILLALSLALGQPLLALFMTLLIGLAKEVWDHFYGSGFCWVDMLANLVGIAVGWPLVLLFG